MLRIAVPPGLVRLIEWLVVALVKLESDQAQIVLNIDADTVAWEIKTVRNDEAEGVRERVERRTSGRLNINRR